jgi:hypothetical protein
LIIEGSKHTAVIGMPDIAETHDERLQQMALVGFVTAHRGEVGKLRQVFLITEAWMSTAEQGKPPHYPPSQDPKRKEVLVVSQLRVNPDKGAVALIEMLPDETGKLSEARQLDTPNQEDVEVRSALLLAFAAGFELGQH